MAAVRSMSTSYKYTQQTATPVSSLHLLRSLKGDLAGNWIIPPSIIIQIVSFFIDISTTLKRGEQCDAHEFYTGLVVSLLEKLQKLLERYPSMHNSRNDVFIRI